ncbi:MAG: hypothetical protein ACI9GW_001988 [Halieaceae bacterium]|jgi:hypothetical protein
MNDYTKAKPIAAGCMAITYNCVVPANNNIILTVGGFLGDKLFSLPCGGAETKKAWAVDIKTAGWNGEINSIFEEDQLLRIDPPETTEAIALESAMWVEY